MENLDITMINTFLSRVKKSPTTKILERVGVPTSKSFEVIGHLTALNDVVISRTGHVVSFDTPQVALQKAQYVMDSHLGGMMFWSTDQDWTRKQSEQPTAPFVAAKWDPSRGAPHRASYGRTKGAPIDPNELT